MIVALVLLALGGMVVVGGVALVSLRIVKAQADRTEEALRTTVALSQARVTTLENRLLSHTWVDYANLQQVPDELSQVSDFAHNGLGKDRVPESRGLTPVEIAESLAVQQGVDLEGATFG